MAVASERHAYAERTQKQQREERGRPDLTQKCCILIFGVLMFLCGTLFKVPALENSPCGTSEAGCGLYILPNTARKVNTAHILVGCLHADIF